MNPALSLLFEAELEAGGLKAGVLAGFVVVGVSEGLAFAGGCSGLEGDAVRESGAASTICGGGLGGGVLKMDAFLAVTNEATSAGEPKGSGLSSVGGGGLEDKVPKMDGLSLGFEGVVEDDMAQTEGLPRVDGGGNEDGVPKT